MRRSERGGSSEADALSGKRDAMKSSGECNSSGRLRLRQLNVDWLQVSIIIPFCRA